MRLPCCRLLFVAGVSAPKGHMSLTQLKQRRPSELGWAALYLASHMGNVALARALMRLRENAGDLAPHGQCHNQWPVNHPHNITSPAQTFSKWRRKS